MVNFIQYPNSNKVFKFIVIKVRTGVCFKQENLLHSNTNFYSLCKILFVIFMKFFIFCQDIQKVSFSRHNLVKNRIIYKGAVQYCGIESVQSESKFIRTVAKITDIL